MILGGKKIAQKILEEMAREVKSRDLDLNLAVVSVGKNLVSQKYLKQKQLACEKVGVGFKVYGFPETIGKAELKTEIEKIGQNPAVSGLVIQLPLPKNLPTNEILNLIPVKKDADCLTKINSGEFYQGNSLILPPVVGAIKRLLEEYKISVKGKSVVVVGAGRLVGLPVSLWLIKEGATVIVCNKLTKNLGNFIKQANLVVSGAGSPNLIKGSMIKKGAIVIDAGTSSEKGKTVGDVETLSVAKKARFLSSVPGGVGPLTIACLLENLLKFSCYSD